MSDERTEDATYTPEFTSFVWTIVDGVERGEIKTTYRGEEMTGELNMLDLGLQFAIGSMMENTGENEFTEDDIYNGLIDYCGNIFESDDGFDRAMSTTIDCLLPWNQKLKEMDEMARGIGAFIILHTGGKRDNSTEDESDE